MQRLANRFQIYRFSQKGNVMTDIGARAAQSKEEFEAALPPVPDWHAPTLHIGADELEFVETSPGAWTKVLQVDVKQGLWIVMTKFEPGAKVPPHYHSGHVYAVTLQGSWFYKESPEAVCRPGSYLFEPAGSKHTIIIPEDQEGPTVVWFAIYGCNVDLDEHGAFDRIIDARVVLQGYRQMMGALGKSTDKVITIGE